MTAIQFSHANGFSAKTYETFLEYFKSKYEISYVDKFGHGEYQIDQNWEPMVRQLILDIETKNIAPVIGIGHSLGGILTFLAAQCRPGLFSQVVIIDPPMFSVLKRRAIGLAQWLKVAHRAIPPAKSALRRRRFFESKEEAYDYLRNKRLFSNFDERCFQDYINYGIVEMDGQFTLDFSADIESRIFLTLPSRFSWKLDVPSHMIYSGKYEVLSPSEVRMLKRKLKKTHFIEVSEGGHMFPLELPESTSQIIMKALQSYEC